LLVITPNFFRDTWQDFTTSLALANALKTGQWRVIPVIKENCQVEGALGNLVQIDLSRGDAKSWGRLIENLSAGLPPESAQQQLAQKEESHKTGGWHRARDGLVTLLELMDEPEIRGPVSEFKADFKALCEQIRVLAGYKKVHDLFQQLEDQYNLIYHLGKNASIQQTDWEAIEIIESRFQDISSDLIRSACDSSFATDQDLWVQKLNTARADMRSALDTKEALKLKSAIRRISGVLNTVPSRVNASMVTAARALRFTSLEKALMTVLDAITKLYSNSVAAAQNESIRKGIDELNGMDTNLRAILYLHDSLQEIDDELRRVEPFLDEDVEQVVDAWQDLKPKMQRLCYGNTSDWASKFVSIGEELEGILATKDRVKIKRMFRTYRSQATRSFHQIDQNLLSLCGELELEIGKPLAPLLALLG
jgi:hypothetical protein